MQVLCLTVLEQNSWKPEMFRNYLSEGSISIKSSFSTVLLRCMCFYCFSLYLLAACIKIISLSALWSCHVPPTPSGSSSPPLELRSCVSWTLPSHTGLPGPSGGWAGSGAGPGSSCTGSGWWRREQTPPLNWTEPNRTDPSVSKRLKLTYQPHSCLYKDIYPSYCLSRKFFFFFV